MHNDSLIHQPWGWQRSQKGLKTQRWDFWPDPQHCFSNLNRLGRRLFMLNYTCYIAIYSISFLYSTCYTLLLSSNTYSTTLIVTYVSHNATSLLRCDSLIFCERFRFTKILLLTNLLKKVLRITEYTYVMNLISTKNAMWILKYIKSYHFHHYCKRIEKTNASYLKTKEH